MNSLFAQNLDPAGLFTQLADNQLGAWSVLTIKILFVTSAFAGLSAFHNVITRYMYALGRSGLLPSSLGRVHAVHRSPYVASFFVSILSVVVILLTAAAGWNPVTQLFAWFSAMGTLGLLFLYTLTAVSIVLFFARTGVDKRLWHTRIAPIASAAGLAGATLITVYNFDAMVGTSGSPVPLIMELVLLALFIAGAGLGLWIRKNKPAAFELIGQSVDEPEENEQAYPASRETAAYG
ncbi:putative amino acid permease YhdG [compost metagenome]